MDSQSNQLKDTRRDWMGLNFCWLYQKDSSGLTDRKDTFSYQLYSMHLLHLLIDRFNVVNSGNKKATEKYFFSVAIASSSD